MFKKGKTMISPLTVRLCQKSLQVFLEVQECPLYWNFCLIFFFFNLPSDFFDKLEPSWSQQTKGFNCYGHKDIHSFFLSSFSYVTSLLFNQKHATNFLGSVLTVCDMVLNMSPP